LQKTPMTTAP